MCKEFQSWNCSGLSPIYGEIELQLLLCVAEDGSEHKQISHRFKFQMLNVISKITSPATEHDTIY